MGLDKCMKHMTFREYVERRDSNKDEGFDWLAQTVTHMPMWGWAIGALLTGGVVWVLDKVARKKAKDKQELTEMHWWSTMFHQLLEKYGPDSEEVAKHLKMADHYPYSVMKSMSLLHIKLTKWQKKLDQLIDEHGPDSQEVESFVNDREYAHFSDLRKYAEEKREEARKKSSSKDDLRDKYDPGMRDKYAGFRKRRKKQEV